MIKELEVETEIVYNPIITSDFVNDEKITKKEFNEKEYATKIIDYKIENEPSKFIEFFNDFWQGFKQPYEITFDSISWMYNLGVKTKKLMNNTLDLFENPYYLIAIALIVLIIVKKI